MKQRAMNPATVVMELPTTEENVLDMACAMARSLSSREPQLILLVAVPQEDGVVHGNAQLQHRAQGFGNIGYLSKEIVGSHIV